MKIQLMAHKSIYPSGGECWFRIKARNGQIVAVSEIYSTRSSMMRTVRRLVKNHNFTIAER